MTTNLLQVDEMRVKSLHYYHQRPSKSTEAEHNRVSSTKSAELKKKRDSERQGIELNMLLQTFHYRNGQLNLRCTAKIAGIYEESSELQLGSRPREPVPERGKLELSSFL